MIDPATQAEVLRLHFAEKKTLRAIAFELDLNRTTVSAIVRRRAVRTHGSPTPRPSMLAPYYPLIRELLGKDPSRSAVTTLQVLRQSGYRGGITILKDYLRTCRPASEPKAYLSLTFLPGQAAQVDWGEFGDVFGWGRKIHAFVMVLCFSRLLYLEFTASATFESFVRCHERALSYFGGVPHEIWYDNLATAVAERRGRLVRFHPKFLTYVAHRAFQPVACNRAAGWEKGRIEDGVRYVRYNFWPDRIFRDLSDLNDQARIWRETWANRRTHETTRKVPELLAEQEQPHLLPLRVDPFDTDEIRSAKVSPQFRVAFDGNLYSVPWRLAHRIVTVRADADTVSIFYGPKPVARHSRSWKRLDDPIVNPRHEEGLRERKPGAQLSSDVAAIQSVGENATRYLQIVSSGTRSLRREVDHLLTLMAVWGAPAVAEVIDRALAAGFVGATHLERWLDQGEKADKKPAPLKLKDSRLCLPPLIPNLKSYDALLFEPDALPPPEDSCKT